MIPASDEDEEVIRRIKNGSVVNCNISAMRNGALFRKWWSLVSTAFDLVSANMEPRLHNGVPVKMCKDRFRKDVTVLAGYYEPVYGADGSVTLEAVSLQWSKMTEETFEKLYSDTIDVILQKVLPGLDEADLNDAMERTLAYA